MAKSKAVVVRGSFETRANRKKKKIITFDAIYREGTLKEIFSHELSRFQARGMADGTGLELTIKGEDLGRDFADFTIYMAGVAIEPPPRDDDGRISIRGSFLNFSSEIRGEWAAQIYLRHIYHRGTRAYIKESWYRLTDWITTVVDIEYIRPSLRADQVCRLAKGFPLPFSSDVQFKGRPPGPAFDPDMETFLDKLRKAYSFIQEIDGHASQADVAAQMRYSLPTLKRRLKDFGIAWPPLFK